MKARLTVKVIEKSFAHGQGRAALRAKTVPPNLAEIFQKGRKTRHFRSSQATDTLICTTKAIYHR
ncbi:hypothetical protein [Rhizobium laguerreae]|uniref:hypothetical protein n=1 Tax=Rhizobium laguerreae TaxID=1076926 RepID=UPI00300AE3B7